MAAPSKLHCRNQRQDTGDLRSVFKYDFHGFIKQRLAKKIRIRSLRPAGKERPYKYESDTTVGKSLTDVAYVDPDYDFSLAVAIYDQKTVFFSSRMESFGFLVVSKEFTKVMRMFYANLWEHSEKLEQT